MKERLVIKAKEIDAPIQKKTCYRFICLEIQSCLKTLEIFKKDIEKGQQTVCSAFHYCLS